MRRLTFHCTIAIALVAATATAPAWSAGKGKLSQAQAEYRQERARCLRGEGNQALATCLKEAGAAYDEARRGRLEGASPSDLARNATQRCGAQPPQDREACRQRIVGAGQVEGSVEGGGLLRRSETRSE